MRTKSNPQESLELGPSTLRVTQAYCQKYAMIDQILEDNPSILAAFHRDAGKKLPGPRQRRQSRFTSD